MRIIRSAVLSLSLCLLLTPNAYAVVAGGMIAIDRQWPSSDVGFLDMEFAITITQEPGRDGFTYWADQFWFKGGDGGYIGLQQRDHNNKALNFSIWKATGWTTEKGTNCAYFDHEGDGVQCWVKFPWKEGTTYKIHLTAEELGHWAAYITDTAGGTGRKIASIEVPQTWGGIYATSSFIEDYAQGGDERASCADVPPTSAVFHQPRAENGTVTPLSSAGRTYGECGSIARVSCTTGQDCIGSANQFGNLGNPKMLRNEHGGNCLDTFSGGDRAGLWSCTANSNQWVERDDYFRMLMRARSKCLQAEPDNKVGIAACTNSSNQRWIPVGASNEIYNVGTGKCLDPMNGGVSGAYIQLWSCLANGYQRWQVTP